MKAKHTLNLTIKLEGKEDIENILTMISFAQENGKDDEFLGFVSEIEMAVRDFKNKMKVK